MTANTTNRSYPYPQSTDDFRPYEDIQALAEAVDDDIAPIARPSICQLVQTSAQTGWTSGTLTIVNFGTSSEIIDTDTLHDSSSNTGRIVIGKRLGWWKLSGTYVAASNGATTLLRAGLRKNGSGGEITGSFAALPVSLNSGIASLATPVFEVEATNSLDYVELMGYQIAASGTIGTSVASYLASSFNAQWIRES